MAVCLTLQLFQVQHSQYMRDEDCHKLEDHESKTIPEKFNKDTAPLPELEMIGLSEKCCSY